MKKILQVVTLFLAITLIAACGVSEQSRTFQYKEEGITLVYTYKHKGNRVTEQTSENTISYTVLNASTKEEAKAIIDPLSNQFQGIEGIKQTVEYGDTEAVEKISVDLNVVDLEKIKELPGMFDEGDASKGIGMKESAALLESLDFVEVSK